ncbi:hypothetical protein GOODEAATRI_032379 [Goodea atripinnis]|uniref:Uncharacterized protein n=1 Tax=Goodea atripinnis TaxID=208336 RepID=A0ABV0NPZ4_9TELE
MLKRLDRIRFRGQRRDEFLDPVESPNTSDTECSEDVVLKPRISVREAEELREPEGEQHIDTQVQEHNENHFDSKVIQSFISVMLLILCCVCHRLVLDHFLQVSKKSQRLI